MILRSEIEFSSAFPDDSISDEDDYVQWPGRNIAEVIKDGLEQRGYRVSDPIHAHEHGWELDIWCGRSRLWLQISVLDAETNYLMADHVAPRLSPDWKLFRAFLLDLQQVLAADTRFSRVRWFEKGGLARGAAPADTPTDT